MSWLKIEKKIIVLKYYLLLFYATMHHFSIGLWHEMKSGFYRWWWPVQWLDREEAPKYFPKPNLHQKKGHGHWLVVCYWSDPLQLSKHWQNHYIWEVYSTNREDTQKTAMPSANIGLQKGPNSSPWQHPTARCTTNASKVEWTGLQFCLICHIYLTSGQPTTTSSSISTIFCRKNASTASRRQKMLCKSLLKPEAQIFMLQE